MLAIRGLLLKRLSSEVFETVREVIEGLVRVLEFLILWRAHSLEQRLHRDTSLPQLVSYQRQWVEVMVMGMLTTRVLVVAYDLSPSF